MYIDTHSHLNFRAFSEDYKEAIKRAFDNGVKGIINVGSNLETSKKAMEIANSQAPKAKGKLYAAIGLHPIHVYEAVASYADQRGYERGLTQIYNQFLELAKDKKVVAIGETGLDYHHFEEDDDIEKLKKIQKKTLTEFIKLANVVQKPAILHCWDGYDDLLEILQNYPLDKKGIIHSFIGSYKTAKKFVELGYPIGLNGIITYSESYDRLIKEIDLKNIVIETDCPYLCPEPQRSDATLRLAIEQSSRTNSQGPHPHGVRNEPAYVIEVAKKIAEIKKLPLAKVEKQTTQNAINLFVLNL